MKNDDVIFELRRLPGKARFEAFFEEGNEVYGKNEKYEKDPDELDEDDVNHHERMLPCGIGAISRRGKSFAGPFERLPEPPWLAFEVRHSDHVAERREHQQQNKQAHDQEKTLPRSPNSRWTGGVYDSGLFSASRHERKADMIKFWNDSRVCVRC